MKSCDQMVMNKMGGAVIITFKIAHAGSTSVYSTGHRQRQNETRLLPLQTRLLLKKASQEGMVFALEESALFCILKTFPFVISC